MKKYKLMYVIVYIFFWGKLDSLFSSNPNHNKTVYYSLEHFNVSSFKDAKEQVEQNFKSNKIPIPSNLDFFLKKIIPYPISSGDYRGRDNSSKIKLRQQLMFDFYKKYFKENGISVEKL